MKREKRAAAPKAAPKKDPAEPLPEIVLPDAQPERLWLWAIGAVTGIIGFTLSAFIALRHAVPGWEERVFRLINSWPEGLYHFFLVATVAPESLWIAVAAVAATFFLKLYRLSWQLAAATIAGYVLTFIAKELIARARPMEFYNDIYVRVAESSMGFPSGHTMIVTVITLMLFPYMPKGWRWVVALLIPLMGLSRIYLGVHLPLDIVGGFMVGLFVVASMRMLPRTWREKLRFD